GSAGRKGTGTTGNSLRHQSRSGPPWYFYFLTCCYPPFYRRVNLRIFGFPLASLPAFFAFPVKLRGFPSGCPRSINRLCTEIFSQPLVSRPGEIIEYRPPDFRP